MKHETIKKFSFMFYVLCFMFVDQITKVIFTSRDFFMGPFHFHNLRNYSLPFGIQTAPVTSLLVIGTSLFFFVWYFFYLREKSSVLRLGFVFIFAGALSNLLDRLFLGYARDFIDINLQFTFNLADLFIAIGICLVFLIGSANSPHRIVE